MSADDYRKAALFTTGSFDQEFQVPDLVGQTEILTEEHRYIDNARAKCEQNQQTFFPFPMNQQRKTVRPSTCQG
jgi:hypothetical protein